MQLSTIQSYTEIAETRISKSGGNTMQNQAMVVIDIQNDITKNYKEIIGNINQAIDWAASHQLHVIYIRHEKLIRLERGRLNPIHMGRSW